MKGLKKNDLIEIEIDDLAFGGKGIGRIDDFVVMVSGALSGQKISAKISKIKKKYAEAKLIRVTEKSPLEIEADWQLTPGAPWIFLPEEIQKKYKKAQTFKLFKDFSGIDLNEVFDDFVDSPLKYAYRNKMDYSFGITEKEGENDWQSFFGLGSRKRGSFYLVENLENPSGIFDVQFEEILPEIREYCVNLEMSPYGYRKNKGFFRYLSVRKSFYENRLMVNLITSREFSETFKPEKFENFLSKKMDGRLACFKWLLYDHCSDAFLNQAEIAYKKGKDQLTEKICGLSFLINQNSFFQTNSLCCEKLYEKVAEYALDLKPDKILDLYCGSGTIAQILAKKFPNLEVIGVESVRESIELAGENSKVNELKNVLFVEDDVKNFIGKYSAESEKLLIVLDPPRSGIVPKAFKHLLKISPLRIIYVSCNPSTMARDAKILIDGGYELKKFSLVDQFPHTHHIEAVGLFERSD